MVERRGKPIAATLSPEQRAQIERVKARGFSAIDEIRARNADKDQEQIDRDVAAARSASRSSWVSCGATVSFC